MNTVEHAAPAFVIFEEDILPSGKAHKRLPTPTSLETSEKWQWALFSTCKKDLCKEAANPSDKGYECYLREKKNENTLGREPTPCLVIKKHVVLGLTSDPYPVPEPLGCSCSSASLPASWSLCTPGDSR